MNRPPPPVQGRSNPERVCLTEPGVTPVKHGASNYSARSNSFGTLQMAEAEILTACRSGVSLNRMSCMHLRNITRLELK